MKIKVIERIIDFGQERFKHKMKNAEASVNDAFKLQGDIETGVANMMSDLATAVKRFRYSGAYPIMFGIYTTPPIVTISFTSPSFYIGTSYNSLDDEEKQTVDFIVNNKKQLLRELDFVESKMKLIHEIADKCPAGSKYAFDKVDGEDRSCIPDVSETRKIITHATALYSSRK